MIYYWLEYVSDSGDPADNIKKEFGNYTQAQRRAGEIVVDVGGSADDREKVLQAMNRLVGMKHEDCVELPNGRLYLGKV